MKLNLRTERRLREYYSNVLITATCLRWGATKNTGYFDSGVPILSIFQQMIR